MSNKPKCAIEGCNNIAMSIGHGVLGKLCSSHHKKKYGMPNGISSKDKRKAKFPNTQCILCSWQGPCDRHRLQLGRDGGQYIKGNIVILCANCHRLLHKGLIKLK